MVAVFNISHHFRRLFSLCFYFAFPASIRTTAVHWTAVVAVNDGGGAALLCCSPACCRDWRGISHSDALDSFVSGSLTSLDRKLQRCLTEKTSLVGSTKYLLCVWQPNLLFLQDQLWPLERRAEYKTAPKKRVKFPIKRSIAWFWRASDRSTIVDDSIQSDARWVFKTVFEDLHVSKATLFFYQFQ